MTNTIQFGADDAPTPEELKSLQKQVEAPRHTGPQVRSGGKTRINHNSDGSITTHDLGAQRVEMPATLAPGHILINGVETTRSAAIAAGLITGDESEDPLQGRGAKASYSGLPAQRGEARPTPPTSAALERRSFEIESDTNQQKPGDKTGDPETVKDEKLRAVQAASTTLEGIAAAHGADTVESHLAAAAETGEVPENLPEGVTTAQVETVIAGYTASADHTLGTVGASVALLEEMFSERELADARRATVLNDQGRLKDLGMTAVSRLETLPTGEPAKFQELLATLPADQRKLVEKRGETWVVKANGDAMPWGVAVRRGIIKLA